MSDSSAAAVGGFDALPVPLGRRVELPGRGTTFVREVAGPPGAPTVVLLHGLMASGGLNWFQVFGPLGQHFRVLAPDLRGHGRGIRSGRRFHLTDCADDVAALLTELGTGPVVAVGYSMGGPVAQLLWKRHPELVCGLVLTATGPSFVPGARERIVFTSMAYMAATTTRVGGVVAGVPIAGVRRMVPAGDGHHVRPSSMRNWAAAEMRRHDWTKVLQAAHSIGRFNSRPWITRIDVPTAVVVTTKDRALPAAGQRLMAEQIPGAMVIELDGGHTACAHPDFANPLLEACQRVVREAARRGPASGSRTTSP